MIARFAAALLALALTGCSLPRIIVLHDPLTAAEHVALGVAYEQQEKQDLAEREYRAALRKDRRYAPAYFSLGNFHFLKRNFDAAVTAYDRAIAYTPEEPRTWNNRSLALLELGRLREADDSAERARALDPENAAYLDTLAGIALRAGDPDRALSWIEQAERHTPLQPELARSLRHYHAEALRALGRTDEAASIEEAGS